MMGEPESTGTGDSPEEGKNTGRRLLRLGLLGGLILGAFLAWELLPPWLSLLWSNIPRNDQRRIVLGFLQGLLVAYGLLVAILGIGVLGVVSYRRSLIGAVRHDPRLARGLLLGGSLLLGMVLVEAGTGLWHLWLHRAPALPKVQPGQGPPPLVLPTEFAGGDTQAQGAPLRILVIGESSARGEPYHPWFSVGQVLGWELERSFPGRQVTVDIWAEGGASLEKMHQKLAELTYRPDVLLLFSGHNEFQARYSWERNPPYYVEELDQKPAESLLRLALKASPFCRLVLETMDRQSVDSIPPQKITRQLVDRPVCTEEESRQILADFRRRLGAIADYCEAIGALPIFIIPASNDRDYEPSRSVLPPTLPLLQRVAFARELEAARGLEAAEPDRTEGRYRKLLAAYPLFAETHYRLARLVEKKGAWDEAREHYIKARELDAMPLRCPDAFRKAYRDVAASRPGIVLVDCEQVLLPLSPHGILDDNLYHDAQHPTFRGYLALARDLLQQLARRNAFGWSTSRPAPEIDEDASARHFELDAKRWAEVCRRSSWFYQVTSFIRHDPAARTERSEAYKQAGEKIKAGTPPEKTGITGLGVHPAMVP